jgi:hypothetical protein
MHGKVRKGKEWKGKGRHGMAWKGKEMHEKERQEMERNGK